MNKKRTLKKNIEQSIIDNRSCHLRDRDIFFRAALKVFKKLTRNIKQNITRQQEKETIHRYVIDMQNNIENALYHASMATRLRRKEKLSAEEQVISDFLLTFNAACNNIKYLISHSLQLQRLDGSNSDHSPQFQAYIKRMLTLDEDSLLKLFDQLKERIHFFNKTMKIQK